MEDSKVVEVRGRKADTFITSFIAVRPRILALSKGIRSLTATQLRRNMIAAPLLSVAGVGIAAISYPLYLHSLGFQSYGLWLVLSTVITFSQIGNLGISQALARYVATALAESRPAEVSELYSSACCIVGFSGSLVLTLVLLLRQPLIAYLRLPPASAEVALQLLPWAAALSVYIYFVDLSNNVLNGLGRLDLCYAFQITAQALALLVSAGFLAAGFGIRGLLLGTFTGYVISHALSVRAGRDVLGRSCFCTSLPRSNLVRRLVSFGGWLFGSSLVSMLVGPLNRLITARYIGLTAVPVFDIAYNSGLRIRNLLESGQRALTAAAIAAKSDPKRGHVRTLVPRALRFLIPSGIVFVAIGFGAPLILRVWLGSAFDASMVPTLRIMLAGSYLSLLSTSSYYVLLGIGCVRSIFTAHSLQSAVNVFVVGIVLRATSHASVVHISAAAGFGMVVAATFLVWRERRAVHLV
jgi:O-antigen/teichoic acid export membrane protein